MTMKKKLVLQTALALAFAGCALTACSNASAASITGDATQYLVINGTTQAEVQLTGAAQSQADVNALANSNTTESNITIYMAPWQTDEIPSDAMPAEEAARVGEAYIYDVFGKSIDGMYVMMHYMDCWLRPEKGRWMGTVSLSQEENDWGALVGVGLSPSDIMFSFTVDSTTGERLDISYTPLNSPPVVIEHDTQVLWESAQGQAVLAMDNIELAVFTGITPERMEIYTQVAYELAQAHFNNTTVQNITLGRSIITPSGPQYLQGIHVLLDTCENGNIFGTPVGLEFTATDHTGQEAIISINEWHEGYRYVRIWVHLFDETAVYTHIIRTIPEELREMWEADDAEVYRLRALNMRDNGISPDDLPAFAMWTRSELLNTIAMAVEVEPRHYAMTREELVVRATIAMVLVRNTRSENYESLHYSYFEWVRDNYTQQDIAVYEEMGAPQWLIDRLLYEIGG